MLWILVLAAKRDEEIKSSSSSSRRLQEFHAGARSAEQKEGDDNFISSGDRANDPLNVEADSESGICVHMIRGVERVNYQLIITSTGGGVGSKVPWPLFSNLRSLPFKPLSPLWCQFQNKTGTEPLTQGLDPSL